MAVGLPLKTTYANGDVYSASDVNDTNGTINANISPYAAGKNAIINGDFRVNQRAFSSTTSSGTYTFDRWITAHLGGTVTYSAQTFTAGTAPVTGYEGVNFFRIVTSGQSAITDFAGYQQRIEDVRKYANQTVTFSFWAKASSGTPKVQPTIEQVFGTGGSTLVTTAGTAVTISTSWARYSTTINVPSISGKTIGTGSFLAAELYSSLGSSYTAYGNIGIQNATIDIWGVQLEAGSVATAFQTATGTIQGELAACQRYYYRSTATAAYNFIAGVGTGRNTTQCWMSIPLPVTLRVNATAVDYANLALDDGGSVFAVTAVALTTNANPNNAGLLFTVASGLAQYRPYMLDASTSGGYIGFTAEL